MKLFKIKDDNRFIFDNDFRKIPMDMRDKYYTYLFTHRKHGNVFLCEDIEKIQVETDEKLIELSFTDIL